VSAPLPANIGNPNNIEQTNASAAPSTTSTTPFNAPPPSTNTSLPPPPSAAAPSYSKPPPAKRTLPPQYGNSTNAPQQMDASWSSSVHPIKSLNPYSPRFTIKARVTSKSEMREWNNAKGNGRLFHVDLVDTTVSADLAI
jgi:replication factor A1